MRSERAHQLRNVIKRMYCSQLLAFQGFVSYERFQKEWGWIWTDYIK